jgi:hypothetical protein
VKIDQVVSRDAAAFLAILRFIRANSLIDHSGGSNDPGHSERCRRGWERQGRDGRPKATESTLASARRIDAGR